MKFSSAIAIAVANLALLVDATIFMTEPVKNTVWKFGNVETCSWDAKNGESGPQTLELVSISKLKVLKYSIKKIILKIKFT